MYVCMYVLCMCVCMYVMYYVCVGIYVFMCVCMYVCICVCNSDRIDRSLLIFMIFNNVRQVYKDSSTIIYLQARNNIFCFEFYKSVAVSCVIVNLTVFSDIVITFGRSEICRTLNICCNLQYSVLCYFGTSHI